MTMNTTSGPPRTITARKIFTISNPTGRPVGPNAPEIPRRAAKNLGT
jgi:hypothetical protein